MSSALPYAATVYWYIFTTLLLVATVGRKLKLRRFYIQVLDRVFSWVAVKMVVTANKEKMRRRMSLGEVDDLTSDDDDESESETTFYRDIGLEKQENLDEEVIQYKIQAEHPNSSQNSKSLESSWEEIFSEIEKTETVAEHTEMQKIPGSISCENQQKSLDGSFKKSEELHFSLDAPMVYLSAGVRAIVDNCVNSSFSREQLKTWNLLSRTIVRKKEIAKSRTLAGFFFIGLIIRYCFLMPMRVLVLILSLTNLSLWTFMVGRLPQGPFKRMINAYVVSFHDKHNRPSGGIAVANHTSPIDGMILATDNCYDMVGQRTKGLLGMFMSALAKSSAHIWFERTDARDRQATTRLLWEHTQHPELPPILIFPEGVCVNNTAILEFRKGAFEVDCDIFPIAIKFDPVYGDAFWFEGGFTSYCMSMMTSWAIVCDVHYLPPMRRGQDESASHFANR
ncbi:hypothetical protein HAZT_HAZT006303 [Hyalella azteca]|uniref:Phospholipid/glycerol acyltransferase domain-containing protein n=1 Tax=Hyalella azteca TaxID=294128 RepID=A0A6A0GVK3_HYAAZ|nr:hypothetical protein HAZT_HAZT006303 [Hyalella azteca]